LKMLMILLISSFCFCNNGSVAITSNDGIVDGIVVHGGFSPSMLITGCSPTYGKGFQVFARACTNQSPKYGVKDCEGRRSFMMDYEVNDSIKNMKQQHGSHGKTSREDNKPNDIAREDIKPEKITSGDDFQIYTRNCMDPAPKQGGCDRYGPRKEKRYSTVKGDAKNEIRKKATEEDQNTDTIDQLSIHHQWSSWTSWSTCPDGLKGTKSIRTRKRGHVNGYGFDKEIRECFQNEGEANSMALLHGDIRHDDRSHSRTTMRPSPRRHFEDVPQAPKIFGGIREPTKKEKVFRQYPLWKALKDTQRKSTTPKSSNAVASIGALVVGVVFLGAIIFIYFKECKNLTNHKTGKEKRQEMRKKTSVESSDNIVTRFVKRLKEYSKLAQSDPNANRRACSRYEKKNNNATRKSKKSVVDEGNITSASDIAIRR